MTWGAIVIRVLNLMGVCPVGDTPSPEDQQLVSDLGNQLLDNWNTQGLELYSYTNYQKALVANQGTYVMGTGAADFNTPRPAKIAKANVITAGVSTPLKIVGVTEWSERPEPGIKGQRPLVLYNDNQFPTTNISLSPIPTCAVATTIDLYYWQPINEAFALTDVFSFPPGYAKALVYNLVVDACEGPYGRPIPPGVASIAAASKAELKGLELSNVVAAEFLPAEVAPASPQAAAPPQR